MSKAKDEEPDNVVAQTQPAVPVVNIANALTVLRLVLVPVFIGLMLGDGWQLRLGATLVFVVASFTDKLDGQLARSRGLITNFGKIADPIADKALTLSAFFMLSAAGKLWWWVTIIILIRELGITALRFIMLKKAVMAASRGGKLKTALQIFGIFGLLAPWQAIFPSGLATFIEIVAYVIIAAALIVTVVSGLDYLRQALSLSRAQARTN